MADADRFADPLKDCLADGSADTSSDPNLLLGLYRIIYGIRYVALNFVFQIRAYFLFGAIYVLFCLHYCIVNATLFCCRSSRYGLSSTKTKYTPFCFNNTNLT